VRTLFSLRSRLNSIRPMCMSASKQTAVTLAGSFLTLGASTTLDSGFAASMGRPSLSTERGVGGGDQAVTVHFVDSVGLMLTSLQGEATLARVPLQRVAVVSLEAISKAEGRPVAGILGGSFFARFAVAIDYARLIVSVYQPRGFVAPRDWTTRSFSTRHSSIAISWQAPREARPIRC
jgi:hypothetical protein